MGKRPAPLLLVLAAVLFNTAGRQTFAQYEPTVGQPHEDFVLPSIDDREPVALSQFRGRKVILIHFASW
jgi:hypothetical protein